MLTVVCKGGEIMITADNAIMFSWLIALVVFLIIEIITLGLTTIWFAGGALVAFVASLVGAPVVVQIVLFFVVSLVLLLFTRPVVQKRLNDSREKTNVNSMVGKEGRVIEAIDNFSESGRIIVNGMEWTARAAQDEIKIPVDTKVTIQEIQGVKALVLPVQQ